MYLNKLFEIAKEKGFSVKRWAEESGVSADTISRLKTHEEDEKDSTRVSTLQQLCKPLGAEMWELFYIGDKSFVDLTAELTAIRAERDELLAKNAVLEAQVQAIARKVDELKDEVIETHRYYMRKNPSGVFRVD